ncbi:hypothetical protein LMBIIBHN_00175 [Aeromonas salmonicida]
MVRLSAKRDFYHTQHPGYLAHMVVTVGQRLQRRASPLMQRVEEHLPHRLRPQYPGVVGLVHQVDQSLGGAEHFFGQGD